MAFKPFRITGAYYGSRPLYVRSNLDALLDAFMADDRFAPTWYGREERMKRPFSRAEVLDQIPDDRPQSIGVLFFGATKPVRYTCDIKLNHKPAISVEAGKAAARKHWPGLFELGTRIADAFRPSVGTLHIWPPYTDKTGDDEPGRWVDTLNTGAAMLPVRFREHGVTGLGLRTWLGPHYIDLLSRTLLESAPELVLADLPWGGLQVDLGNTPWKAEADELGRRFRVAMDHLGSAGVFAKLTLDDRGQFDYTAGPRHTFDATVRDEA